MTGKLGHALVGAWVGAWHGVWVHSGGDVKMMWWWGWEKCSGILPGLVRLDLGMGGGLVWVVMLLLRRDLVGYQNVKQKTNATK